ncbi:Radical SAM domain protein [Pyrolobus fumarii 1A]|uniref:Radical SAM domain protein n=1 Tax=Pyrolobus fumarii (strain DSM 11204 / 1A) TaxID=694429 RepID=G0EDT9_PYRF1|nr:radical SAM protein [Pyrolobus fumarii]AEM38708.1 Radical SAM domain protein [Pyrolobus fumarii 1A]
MRISKVLILDGYTDEPAGLGVPPYIDVYPRYIAGAVWSVDKSIRVDYVTVDEARKDIHKFIARANEYDLLVVIAGVVVPGKYLGGEPIRLEELKTWFRLIEKPFKVLVGPAARFGISSGEGGRVAALPKEVSESFDAIVKGDPELYVYRLLSEGESAASPYEVRRDYSLVDKFAVLGAKIVEQHPNHGYNLIAEIETFRGCPRNVVGGCSFCIEPAYGRPVQRSPEAIVREVEALYRYGVRAFRLGRQPDILIYGSPEIGDREWPRPNPEALRRLLHGIRSVAPELETLHIDNVNPGTIVHHKREAREALKVIIEYHTPGDVAAMGIESADPRVIEANNLGVYPDEALEAIRVVNELGAKRGWNGLPELLPGINFVLGLKGETKETYRLNLEFIERVYREGLLVRRINVRQVLILPGTRMWGYGDRWVREHRRLVQSFKRRVMQYSRLFLQRVVPRGTILRRLYIEYYEPSLGVTFARQTGSYPLVAELPCKIGDRGVVDVVVYAYGARSVRGLPLPLEPNKTPLKLIREAFGSKVAEEIARWRPFTSDQQLRMLGLDQYFSVERGYACTP